MDDLCIYWFSASVRQAKPRFKWTANTAEGRGFAALLIEPCGLIYPETQEIGDRIDLPSLAEVTNMEEAIQGLKKEDSHGYAIPKCENVVSRILEMAHHIYPAERELRRALSFIQGLKLAELPTFASLRIHGLEDAEKWYQRITMLDAHLRSIEWEFKLEEGNGFPHRRESVEKIFEAGRRSGVGSAQRKYREQNKKKKLARPEGTASA